MMVLLKVCSMLHWTILIFSSASDARAAFKGHADIMHSGSWSVWKHGVFSCQRRFPETKKCDSNLFHMLNLQTDWLHSTPLFLRVMDEAKSGLGTDHSNVQCTMLNHGHFTQCNSNVFRLVKTLCLLCQYCPVHDCSLEASSTLTGLQHMQQPG